MRVKLLLKKIYYSQVIRFGFVAGTSALFELVIYTILFEVVKMDPLTSSPISQVFSMIFNFFLNKVLTFKTSRTSMLRESMGYLVVWGINLLITTVLMALLLGTSNIYPTIIRLFVMIVMFFFNFFALKLFVFKKPE